MTCQSSLLIRVVNELFLPLFTLESDFRLLRWLQSVWLHARETALPYFSGSSALLKGWRRTVLKMANSTPFYSILFYSLCLQPSQLIYFYAKPKPKKGISSANDLSQAEKRHWKYQPLYFCRQSYEFALQNHVVLKCHILRLRSWYAGKRILQNLSGQDACHEAGSITQRVEHFLFNHKRFTYCLCPSGCGLFQYVLYSTFFTKALCCSSKCCRSSWCMRINDAVQNPSEFTSRP